MNTLVLLEREDALACITLNRPECANVLDVAAGECLASRIEEVARDPSVRALLLRARGPQFCGGGDIAGMTASGEGLAQLLARHLPALHRAVLQLARLPVPVVSAVQGPLGGGGIGLALCADVVLAAESVKMRGGYTAIGLSPDVGTSWLLARRVGAARAKEILFTNRTFSAVECLQMGLFSQLWPDGELADRAQDLARLLARSATGALIRTKALVDGAASRTLAEQLALEQRWMVECAGGPDAIEGVQAFMQRRPPTFVGRGP